ncbi:MAG: hypothetical protein ACOYXC_10165 [Candidatus Rifleibacteriota bacterium]
MCEKKLVMVFILFISAWLFPTGCQKDFTGSQNLHSEVQVTGSESAKASVTLVLQTGDKDAKSSIVANPTGTQILIECSLYSIMGDGSTQVVTLKKQATTTGTEATLTFDSLPVKATLAKLSLTGGNVGGYKNFRGGIDLVTGPNQLVLQAEGTKSSQDIIGYALEKLVLNNNLLAQVKTGAVARIANSVAGINTQTTDPYATIEGLLPGLVGTPATPTFSRGTAKQLASDGNFPGIVYDGTRLVISYGKNKNLYIQTFDTNFQSLGAETAVTSSSDPEIGIGVTDHKHIFLSNNHYMVFSTVGDDDLYLIKLDASLNRVGTIVKVVENSTTTRTNDMMLGTDGTSIFVGQYRPSNLNSNEPTGHLIKVYDASLNLKGSDVAANSPTHNNPAAFINFNGLFHLIAPSGPVFNATVPTQRDLLLCRFNNDWSPYSTSATKLIDSKTLTHTTDGDGIWMATGLAYDSPSGLMLTGHTFVYGAGGSDTGPLYFRVFDSNNGFTQVFSEKMVDSNTANRAHFLLLNNELFVTYDDNSGGPYVIYGFKYTINR